MNANQYNAVLRNNLNSCLKEDPEGEHVSGPKREPEGAQLIEMNVHIMHTPQKPRHNFASSPTSSPTIALPSLPNSAPSTPHESVVVSPPRVHRFSANGVLPMLPIVKSSPNLLMDLDDSIRREERLNDHQECSIQLIDQWRDLQRIIDDRQEKVEPIETDAIIEPARKPKINNNPRSKHQMNIHPNSIRGTTEAAAWYLHGQTGGRVAPIPSDKSQFGRNVSVMNSKAMSRMRKEDKKLKQKVNKKVDIESGRYEDDTNVLVDFAEKGARITSKAIDADEIDGDRWSTGVASAIVMGTAARYNKTLCMFPHGRRVLLPIIMAVMALALSIYVSISCRFMTIQPGSSVNDVFQIGPWFYLSTNPQSDEICMPYPSDVQLDIWFTVARSMSALAVCLGLGLLLWTSTLTCIPYSRSSLNGLGVCYFIASILQLATSFFYLSQNCRGSVDEVGNTSGGGYFGGIECSANQDLVFCISAAALYFATGWLLYVAQGVIANDPGSSSSEVYTWSAVAKSDSLDNGIRTIEKSWIRIPDGSTLVATVVVERRRGKKGGIKTTHQIKTEMLPAS